MSNLKGINTVKSNTKAAFERNPLARSITLESLALSSVLASQLFMTPVANAAPTGGHIVGGSGSVANMGRTTKIDQTSHHLAINWDSFNVGSREQVVFHQPSASALVLNRILDQSPSTIRGSIVANGNVLLVNPRGIMFTESATVNVGGLVASGLDVSVDDFMNGNLIFKGIDGRSGAVINQGVINASSAALIGKTVHNAPKAVISANVVSLSAGDEALLTFDADGFMGVKVTKEVLENGLGLDNALLNEGKIEGNQVLLEASVSRDLFSNAVNNRGLVTAKGIDVSGGTIRLSGNVSVTGESLINTGRIEAEGAAGDVAAIQIDAHELRNSGTIHSGQGGMSIELGRGGMDNHQILGNLTGAGDVNVNARGGEVGTDSFAFSAGASFVLGDGHVLSTGGVTIAGADIIDAGDDGVLQGRDGVAEAFTITGSRSVQVNNMAFVNVTRVEAGSGAATDSVTGGSDWALNGANSIKSQGLTFTDVEHVVSSGNGKLTGRDNVAEAFVITGNESLHADGIGFDNISAVNAGAGAAPDSVSGADHWELQGSQSVSAGGIRFTGVERAGSEAVGSRITGRDEVAETFAVSGHKTVSADGIEFTNVIAVDAGAGSTPDSVVGTDHWGLNGAQSVMAEGMTFTNVERAGSDTMESWIIGRDNEYESFAITGNQQLRVDGITFSNVARVDAGSGEAVDSVAGAISWALKGSKRASAGGILFTDIEQVTGGGADIVIAGRDQVAESFVINDSKKVTVDKIRFSNVIGVHAGTGDVADQVSGAVYWTLNGGNSVIAGGMTFNDVEQVSGSGATSTLTGRNDVADRFVITGNKTLTANHIAFDNISVVIAGAGTEPDKVTGSGQWLLNGNQSVKAQGMTFSGVEKIGAYGDNSQLTGSQNSETFVLTGNNRLTVSGMDVSGVGSVVGQSNDRVQDGGDLHYELHSQTGAQVANLYLQGLALTNIQWDSGDSIALAADHTLTGKSIDSKGAWIIGSEHSDTFVLTGVNAVEYSDVAFTNVTQVDALAGQDSVVGAADWVLQANQSARANGVTFHNIEHASSPATESRVTGRAGVVESFAITGSKAVSVEGIAFSNVMAVDGGGGTATDKVTGATEWRLNGSRSLIASDMTFTDIEQAGTAGRAGAVIGRNEVDEAFIITGDRALTVDDIAFTHITSVDAGSGSAPDRVTGATEWALQGHQRVSAGGITFSGIEHAGSAGLANRIRGQNDVGEAFVITGHQAMSADGIRFDSVASVDAGSGALDDRVSGADIWQLNGHRNVTAAGIEFTGVEQAGSDAAESRITGRDHVAESFAITGTRALHAEGIAFTNVDGVDAGSGAARDSVSGAAHWQLNGNQSVTADGIVFNGIEQAVGAGHASGITGQDQVAESFAVTGNRAVTVEGIAFENVVAVNAGAGTAPDRVTGAAEWQLNGKHSVIAENMTFHDIEEAGSSELSSRIVGEDGVSESFLVTGNNAVTVGSVKFDNIHEVIAAAGGDDRVEAAAAVEWQLTGGLRGLIAQQVTFRDVEAAQHCSGVSGYSRITGSNRADNFNVVGLHEIVANGVRISDVDRVDGGTHAGGRDVLMSSNVESWQLSTHPDIQVKHSGIRFNGLEEVQGAMGSSLKGTAGNDDFVVGAVANRVSRDNLTYSNITRIDGGAGTDTLIADRGFTWQLTDTAKELLANGITYTNIDIATAADSVVKGRNQATDIFNIGADPQQLTTQGMIFNQVARVEGGTGAGDTVISHTSRAWQLTRERNSLQAAGMTFTGIDAANFSPVVATPGSLHGSGADETFDVSGSQRNAVRVNGVAFSGIGAVDAGAGNNRVVSADAERWTLTGVNGEVSVEDIRFSGVTSTGATSAAASASTLRGSAGDETYLVDADNATIEAAGIRFDHISAVDAGGGRDTVDNIRDTHWLAAERGGSWMEGSAEALVNSVWVLFANIEQVLNTGRFSGPSMGVDYTLTDTHAARVGGINFDGVSTIFAGSGADTLYGLNQDTEWTVNGRSGSTQYLGFSGIDTIRAGSARDVFAFNSGLSGNIFTGDGDDTVYLNGGSVGGLYLQGGADRLFLNNATSAALLLDGGPGTDSLASSLTDLTWRLTGDVNQVNYLGDHYAFTGFETLRNEGAGLRINTTLATGFALDRVVFEGAGISLDYRPAGDVQLTSHHRGANAIAGDISGSTLHIRAAGDVDLNTRAERLNILSQDNRSLNIRVREADSLMIGQIHAGAGGAISLTSMSLGALTAEARGVTHLIADTVNLGTDWQGWSTIGEQMMPLRMEVGRAVNIVALSYVEPEFVNGIPSLTATGNRLQSVAGAVASQGMKSAVQVNVEEFAQVDPAIFTAVSPYSVNADALNAPEYAVIAGELMPAGGIAQSSGEIDGERATLKEEGE